MGSRCWPPDPAWRAMLPDKRGELLPIPNLESAKERSRIAVHRIYAHPQPRADLAILQPVTDQLQHRLFAGCQPEIALPVVGHVPITTKWSFFIVQRAGKIEAAN